MPFDDVALADQFQTPEALVMVSQAAEKAGFESVLVTDHPVPTGRWLDAGGHHAQDPFVMLALIAGVTKTIKLQTGIVVLPYRNPFIVARAMSTLDVFSRGRVMLGVGAGYMKAEYKAVGADFEARHELMDEYIKAIKAAWTQDEFTFKGTGYEALGNRILPRPMQQPHPPIIIGGNAKRAIRRAVELGDAWNPYLTSGALAATSRTAEMATDKELAENLDYMRAHCEAVGRATPPELRLGTSEHLLPGWHAQEQVDKAGAFAQLGAVAMGVTLEAKTLKEWCEAAERFSTEVIAKAK
jgi:probable F420-dependent oxidoreductase